MRFRYPLQKILDLKSTQTSQAEWMLSQAIGTLREEEQTRNQLELERERLQNSLTEKSQRRTTISDMLAAQQYINHLDLRINLKNRDVEKAHQTVVNRQEHLTDRMLDEKVWMKAREKAKERFLSVALKKEQDELDEMATVRYIQPT